MRQECAETLPAFLSIWQETLEALKTYAAVHRQASHCDKMPVPFSEIWRNFMGLCEAYDITATEYFDANAGAFRAALDKAAWLQLERAIRRYDFPWITPI